MKTKLVRCNQCENLFPSDFVYVLPAPDKLSVCVCDGCRQRNLAEPSIDLVLADFLYRTMYYSRVPVKSVQYHCAKALGTLLSKNREYLPVMEFNDSGLQQFIKAFRQTECCPDEGVTDDVIWHLLNASDIFEESYRAVLTKQSDLQFSINYTFKCSD